MSNYAARFSFQRTAASLPWLLLANKAHRVVSEGFPVEDVEAMLRDSKGAP